ncbi:amino acid permease [Arthrobacter zhangbolii]|uniref:Amino acid permease n=1 Tax=Arthrobacter zhangbolii TaxID=2886936 RepID=A0A9X1SCG7_9MICC|nr:MULTISPECIES: amino acid permease [Arthrobacter]MCC3273884.1 amino acid permease [Arthrobacter zhangbolii]MCC3294677.1 amino acid permease [Arthrobacter zhangbolii]MDN3904129.1 amino acid permease [Arthrobacter sp. YD2]UON93678.1 amino acid permease [Arthrobacter zhangbolii]
MQPRHLVLMSLGSAIGTGLFVGSGAGIAAAGPAVLISFLVAGTMVILVMRMMGEMAAADPNSGAFSVYAEKALGRTAGTTVGWLWWIQIVIVIAAEATAAAAIVTSLIPGIEQWILALAFIVVFTAINLAGAASLGEFEYWFAILKVAAIIIFLAVGAAFIAGWLPGADSPGVDNLFNNGGFMPNGITGVAAGLLLVVFAFGGTEIVTIAAADTEEPSKSIAGAITSVIWRILIFYIGSVLVMVTVLPWDNEALNTGPFVAVLHAAQVPGADTVMAVVIVIALLSAMNANLYGASRMIYSLGDRGRAPAALARLGRGGVPRRAVVASVAFGFIAVVLNYLYPDTVLMILLNLVGSTCLVVWGISIVSQIILRRRADAAGVELTFRMWAFPWLSYFALALLAAIVVLGFFDAAVRVQLVATAGLTAALVLLAWLFDRRTTRRSRTAAADPAE